MKEKNYTVSLKAYDVFHCKQITKGILLAVILRCIKYSSTMFRFGD